MLVKDVMTPDPVTIQADANVSEAAAILRKRRIGGIPVMDGERLVGIVTETDLLSLLDVGELSEDLWLPSPLEIIEIPIREFVNWEKTRKALTDISESPISDIMSTDVIYIDENAEIEEAAKLMLSEGIARLPVVKGDRLVGIVTRQDIVRGIGTAFPEGTED
ncbi:CBS domain-containing protein [Methanolacinia paynteri]|uniref:CBS domain-containing protein n=1 Tax=Methanolacinia paynteri TaxID=230356 RepID=UPI00064E4758|nr:CBS domain-containing protein [Methanolacinia paynteri]